MKLRYRLILFAISMATLILVGFWATGSFWYLVEDFWFASGLLLLIMISLFDQPFFSTDANIFNNAIAGSSLILVEPDNRDFWWWAFLVWCIWLVVSSLVLLSITAYRPKFNHPLRTFISKINREIGRPQALFSAFFVWGAFLQFGQETSKLNALLLFWAIFIVFNLPGISRAIDAYLSSRALSDIGSQDVGSLLSIADPRLLEIDVAEQAPARLVGKTIDIMYSSTQSLGSGIIIDDRIVAGQRVSKLALTDTVSDSKWGLLASKPARISFTVRETQQESSTPISIVDSGSNIGFLQFQIHPDTELERGQLVWSDLASDKRAYYQIASATIVHETSSEANNSIKYVSVRAGQLGIWDEKSLRFEPHNWVPPAGYLVHRLSKNHQLSLDFSATSIKVGNIPNSPFPVHVDSNDIVTHNTAIVGVTGSGKSWLAFHIISEILKQDIKVLILDISREHWSYIQEFDPTALRTISELKIWLDSESKVGVHQFANSASYPQTTSQFVDAVFEWLNQNSELQAGVNLPAKICIVFEEAHSLIPEWNQVASKNDSSHVNATARKILQGRKFGMGSLIITQRTANVTKTILNQCNTIFAMRSFDQTGLDFLANYMGGEYAQAIPTLPSRTSILVGKASSCLMPVIFDVVDLKGRWEV